MASKFEETKLCANCNKNINVASFLMHEAFCLKNMVKCAICGESYDKNTKDEHFEENHARVKCECGESMERRFLENHKSQLCRKRQVKCLYCDLTLDFDKLDEHVEYCGSRTQQCDFCKRYIKMRDQQLHEETHCAYPHVEEPSKRPNLNNNDIFFHQQQQQHDDFRVSSRLSNQLIPCEFCSEVFPMYELMFHQSTCSHNPDNAIEHVNYETVTINNTRLNPTSNNNVIAPAKPSADGLDTLEARLKKNLRTTTFYAGSKQPNQHQQKQPAHNSTATRTAKKEAERINIPCEFCAKLFDFNTLHDHQLKCQANPNNSDEDIYIDELNSPRISKSTHHTGNTRSLLSHATRMPRNGIVGHGLQRNKSPLFDIRTNNESKKSSERLPSITAASSSSSGGPSITINGKGSTLAATSALQSNGLRPRTTSRSPARSPPRLPTAKATTTASTTRVTATKPMTNGFLKPTSSSIKPQPKPSSSMLHKASTANSPKK